MDFLYKAPFVRMLAMLLAGILLQSYFDFSGYVFPVFVSGVSLIMVSFLMSPKRRFSLRPLFGVGIALTLIAIGVFSTSIRQMQSRYLFSGQPKSYIGVVSEVPQQKPRSIACKLQLDDLQNHKIVCYFQPDSLSKTLVVGDKVIIYAAIRPFRNMGNPDDFDYVTLMHRKGFSGTAYAASGRWDKLAQDSFSFYALAQKFRSHILDFYRNQHLGQSHFAIFSALTVGYMDELDDSLQQSFRATGTSHILSVSGLHVAIIYMVIGSLLNFFPKRGRLLVLKQGLIIAFLWGYAFLTGLPPSVVRATLMISVFCIAVAMRRKAFSYNTVCFAAFLMLIYNPFDFFNIGFQLSFGAVLSICFFLPPILKVYAPMARIPKFFWEMFAVSVAVQLGTYPICLYYFGTFPTYFFLTNLVIVPLSTFVMYFSLGLYFAAFVSWLFPAYSAILFFVPVFVLKSLLAALLGSVSFFESLPYALLENISLNLPEVFLLVGASVCLVWFLQYRCSKSLSAFLSVLLLFLILKLPVFGRSKDTSLYIFNRSHQVEIGRVGGTNFVSTENDSSAILFPNVSGCNIVVVKSNRWKGMAARAKFSVDYLVVSGNDSLSMYQLNKLFEPKCVVLDGTLPSKAVRRLKKQCRWLNLDCYDLRQNGALKLRHTHI